MLENRVKAKVDMKEIKLLRSENTELKEQIKLLK